MLRCQQGRAAGKTQWNRWLSKGPGQEGEELDEDDMFQHKKGGSKTRRFAPCHLGKKKERRLENLWVRTTQLSSFLEVPPLFVLLEYSLGML